MIVDSKSNDPVSFASIYVYELRLNTASDEDGRFSFSTSLSSKIQLNISCIGYQSLDTTISISKDPLVFKLQPLNYTLQEIIVSAQESSKDNAASIIEKAAMEHIQPSSFADILQLLPGHLVKDSKMEAANFITMRQAGSDVNTSLGTAFIIDGAPLTNDANMQNIYGVLSTEAINSHSSTSKGIDMRTISTDRIEKVEIIRGIPSVEHGDLTAGVVKIEMKSGKTPWEGRAKVDLNNKLFSIGKGFLLPKSSGVLNIDADYVHYQPDPRIDLTSYKRVTFSSRYQNRFDISESINFRLKANMSYTGSFDDEKTDDELAQGKEFYKSNHNNLFFSANGIFQMQRSFINEINFNLSSSFTKDKLERTRIVVAGAKPLSSAKEEGAHYATYLPSTYIADLTVDDQPFSLSADIQAKANSIIGKLRQNLLFGMEWRYNANLGNGEIYDINLPPYPSDKSTRPRPYKDVPFMQKLSAYAEDAVALQLGDWRILTRLGVRATTLPGQSEKYKMSNRWYVEPRINARLSFPSFTIFDKKGIISLNAGYGQHYKFPTQAQLYPTDIYFDYIQLNYYSQQETLRSLNIQTWIEDPTNYNLQPALNTKYEVGINLGIAGMSFDITIFDERMKNGFSRAQQVVSHTFRDYDETAVPPGSITQAPKVEDFPYVNDTSSALFYKTYNNAEVHKQGIEYQMNFGRIIGLYTNIRLSGAWFHTSYSDNGLRYTKPSVIINGRTYPYAGVYNWSIDNKKKQEFNMTLYLDTHIPVLKMIFTTSVQAVWFEKSKTDKNNGLPIGYIDDAGRYHAFTSSDIERPIMQHLITIYNENYFKEGTIPFMASLNLKLTKEIGKALRISFYVNRLLNYTPDYTTQYGTKATRSLKASFGAELNIKI